MRTPSIVAAFVLSVLIGPLPAADPPAKAKTPPVIGAKEKLDPFGPDAPLPPGFNDILDPDGSGTIDDEEAAKATEAFQKLPKTRQPIGQEIRKALDANGDRKVDESEAKVGVSRGRANIKGVAKEVAEIVKRLDADGDQKISVQEFRGIVKQLGVVGLLIGPKLGQFFDEMDANQDGQISLVESQRGAEFLVEQIKLAEEENRRKALLADPLYQQAQMAVASLDRNKDQLISKPEAKKNGEVNAAFTGADTNLDDQLSVDECYAYLKSQAGGDPKKPLQKVEFLPKGDLQDGAKKKPRNK